MSFRLKVIAGLFLIQSLILSTLFYICINILHDSTKEGLITRAQSTTQLLASLAKDSVLSYDLATLASYADDIMQQPGMAYIRIVDHAGNILVTAGQAPVNSIQADQDIFHSSDSIFDSASEIKENNMSFGRVEIGLDTQFAQHADQQTRQLLIIVSLISILISTIFTLFLSRYLTLQLNALVDGAKALAKGDREYRIPVSGADELTQVSISFNHMAENLSQTYTILEKESAINNAMFETSPSGIFITDAEGKISHFNQAAEKLFDYQAKEIYQKNIKQLIPDSDTDALHPNDHSNDSQEIEDSRKAKHGKEMTACKKSGEVFPIHLAIGDMEIQNRHLMVGIITDITERKKNEWALQEYKSNLETTVKKRTEELEIAKDAAEAGAKTKSAFIANMSHEIRTPMNAIIGFSEVLLMDTSVQKKTRKQVSTILQSAKSLLSIINDILDVSKLESGKFSLEEIAFHLPNALAEALKTIEFQAEEKGLKLSLIVDNSLSDCYIGDPTRLRQVILNLVSNAIKFTEKGFVKVQVESDQSEKDTLLFRVLDSGIGMSEQQCKRIFEPFTQADTSTTRRFGGTGLGTSICKQIVELMHGEITVKSQPGIGSEFFFTYKMAQAPKGVDCLYDDSNISHDEYVSPRTFNILLAEDIETNAQLVTLRLEHLGHKITWVRDGQEAVTAYIENDFDLILMDIMMPNMDGLEAARQIRYTDKDKNKPIVIMALTASVMREDHQHCRDAGMNRVEAKPIDFKKLLQDMEELVSQDLGQQSTLHNIELSNNTCVDFSPIKHCINADEAISVWQDALIYVQALQKFADEHEQDSIDIKKALQEPSDNGQTARVIAHTLKGLAGNLQFKEITELTIEIDAALKANHLDHAVSRLDNLHRELQRAVIAIRKLKLPESSSQTSTDRYDSDSVSTLLKQLSGALLELNPDHAAPIMSEIEKQLSSNELHSIQQAIDSFDFDQAQINIQKLAAELELNID